MQRTPLQRKLSGSSCTCAGVMNLVTTAGLSWQVRAAAAAPPKASLEVPLGTRQQHRQLLRRRTWSCTIPEGHRTGTLLESCLLSKTSRGAPRGTWLAAGRDAGTGPGPSGWPRLRDFSDVFFFCPSRPFCLLTGLQGRGHLTGAEHRADLRRCQYQAVFLF